MYHIYIHYKNFRKHGMHSNVGTVVVDFHNLDNFLKMLENSEVVESFRVMGDYGPCKASGRLEFSTFKKWEDPILARTEKLVKFYDDNRWVE